MKAIFILIMASTIFASTNAFQNNSEPTGFKNIKFLTPIKKINTRNWIAIRLTKNIKTHIPPENINAQIGRVKCTYEFYTYKNVFVGYSYSFKTDFDFEFITEICKEKYGDNWKLNSDWNYIWQNNKITVILNQSKKELEVYLTKFYNTFQKEQTKQTAEFEKEEKLKALNDL